MNELSDDDMALIRAYSDAYRAAGGEKLPDTLDEVIERLRDEDALTENDASALGQQDGVQEAEQGDGDPFA
jgi:hypothetical protein